MVSINFLVDLDDSIWIDWKIQKYWNGDFFVNNKKEKNM